MKAQKARKWLHEYATERNSHELARGDVIDVKASILLVVIFFLADKISELKAVSQLPAIIRYAGCFALAICAVLCIAALWPRNYSTEPMPHQNEEWIIRLERYFADDMQAVDDDVAESNFVRLKDRAKANKKISDRKMRYLEYSFYVVIFSVVCYLTLLAFGI